jgi:hypothetical protein
MPGRATPERAIIPGMKVSRRMGGAIHENHERWCAPRLGPTRLDCYGRKRKAQPSPSPLSSWDDCVDQLLATYEQALLCAS